VFGLLLCIGGYMYICRIAVLHVPQKLEIHIAIMAAEIILSLYNVPFIFKYFQTRLTIRRTKVLNHKVCTKQPNQFLLSSD